jgi:hypothetical protein
VASSRRSRGSEIEDSQSDDVGCGTVEVGRKYSSLADGWSNGVGCGVVEVGRKYPYLVVISFSVCRGIFVFFVGSINRIKGLVG